MNLIQKMHAIMVSDKVHIWHYPNKKDGPLFWFWKTCEPGNQKGYGYYSLERMIEVAYDYIDPQQQPLPKTCNHPNNIIEQ